ncbi:MAG: hypothetical protein ACRDOO_03705, partial [Actinomadura sp.]
DLTGIGRRVPDHALIFADPRSVLIRTQTRAAAEARYGARTCGMRDTDGDMVVTPELQLRGAEPHYRRGA